MEDILTLVLTSVITFFVYELLRTVTDKIKGKRGKKMGSFGRYRTSGTKRRYRISNKRRGKSTLKKARSRGYGFAYGYVRESIDK